MKAAKPGPVKFCGNCGQTRFDLADEDLALIAGAYRSYERDLMEKSWVGAKRIFMQGNYHVDRPVNPEKERFVRLSGVRAFCPVENCLVPSTGQPCYGWQPRRQEAVRTDGALRIEL